MLIIVAMTIGPYLPFVDSNLQEELIRMETGTIEAPPYPPSEKNLLGSDHRGKDLLSLIVLGTKDTMLIIFAVTVIRYIFAVPLGFAASRKVGGTSWIVNIWNKVFTSIPTLFSAIILLNLPFLIFSENRLLWSILLIALIEVGRVAEIVQEQSYSLSKELYVEAGKTMGFTPLQSYSRDYLPNLLPELIVMFFIDLGRVALLIGQLGMLSIFISQAWIQTDFTVGVIKNTSLNWATLLGEARGDLLTAPWIPLFAAAAITLTIIAFNLTGEGLRRWFHHRSI